MSSAHSLCSPLAAQLLFLATASASLHAADEVNFNRDIRPLLSDRCMSCHGPDASQREADLDLADLESVIRDREGYQVVQPGNPDDSELIRRIMSSDEDEAMPPADSGKALTGPERDLLKRWIADGAVWLDHWAYVEPQNHSTPNTNLQDWTRNWVDSFVAEHLEQVGLLPSPDADPVTLIRRLHLDLTGLPPDPDRVDELLQRWSDNTYEQLVDELLTSEASAERLAIYWLDLVRYADTVGYHGDQDHNISPYRDWVIDAFFLNMRFDQFTKEQLAGDLLPDSTTDQKTASGYNRLLQTTHEGGLQPREYLAIYAADRVRNLSVVWLGATLGCAQCHDHKYDPLTSRDFYSLQAFFADLDEDRHFTAGSNSLPTTRAPEIKVHSRREREALTKLRTELKLHTEAATSSDKPDNPSDDKRTTELRHAIEDLEANARLTMISVAKQPRPIRILPRGNWMDDSGPIVEPAVPAALGRLDTAGRRATRLDLANWLVDSEDGVGLLTARVMANRFWYLMFGQGLSRSLDDFGGQGFAPDHPELLDRLAIEFVESGWNVRHMLRTIALSRTYRQSSVIDQQGRRRDPDNRQLARQASFRLPAETIRDNALAISGLLVQKVGGSSVKPYQPVGYYRHLNFPKRKYTHHDDERQWKRGIYIHWQRQFLHPMLKAFDAPTREECTAERPISNTPLAALVLLNDPTFVEASRAFGQRMRSAPTAHSDAERIQFGFRRATSREPDATELELLLQLLQETRDALAEDSVNQPDAEGDAKPAEVAAWSEVGRAILNLDEVLTRS
jgi:Protein of unknown function (DUF1553)/Protein of unknown function (DUF1549)/Planctomycete cytochrome C